METVGGAALLRDCPSITSPRTCSFLSLTLGQHALDLLLKVQGSHGVRTLEFEPSLRGSANRRPVPVFAHLERSKPVLCCPNLLFEIDILPRDSLLQCVNFFSLFCTQARRQHRCRAISAPAQATLPLSNRAHKPSVNMAYSCHLARSHSKTAERGIEPMTPIPSCYAAPDLPRTIARCTRS